MLCVFRNRITSSYYLVLKFFVYLSKQTSRCREQCIGRIRKQGKIEIGPQRDNRVLATLTTIPLAMCGDGAWMQTERIGAVCRGTRRQGFQRLNWLSRLPTAASNREAGLFADRSSNRVIRSRRVTSTPLPTRTATEVREKSLSDRLGQTILTLVLFPLWMFTTPGERSILGAGRCLERWVCSARQDSCRFTV